MEPTADEKTQIVSLDTLATWAGLSDAVSSGADASPRGRAFAAWGMAGDLHFRLLAVVPLPDLEATFATMGANGTVADFAAKAAVRLMHNTARSLCHLQPWPSAAVPPPAAGLVPPVAGSAAAAPSGDRFKFNLVVDQTNDNEAEVLLDPAITTLYSNYRMVTGGLPPKDATPSIYQLTAIDELVRQLKVPYVDFSIFVPNAMRHMKRNKLAGSVLGSDGRLQPIELYGPPNYDSWEKCYEVLATALLMTKAVSLSALGRYRDLIKSFAARYGPSVWHLTYQADIRMRGEHMERLRIAALQDRSIAVAAGRTHPFDPMSPWEFLWSEACRDNQFWLDELQENSMLVLTRTASLASMVDSSTAIVHSGANANMARQHALSALPPPPPPAPGRLGRVPAVRQPSNRPARSAHNVSNGQYTSNRRYMPLCPGWQDGSCTAHDPRTNRCSANPEAVHQCSKCLSTTHGANVGTGCNSSPPSEASARVQPKGGGKGKRQGKGKGGGKGGYYRHGY